MTIKKITALLMLSVLPLGVLTAQDEKDYLPKAGDLAIGIDMQPVYTFFGNLANGDAGNTLGQFGGEDPLGITGLSIIGKYMLDKYRGDIIVPILVKQVLRSGTSIAANITESKNAQSKNDFINKLNIALKEADETGLWLELLHESDYLSDSEFDSVYDDNQKIVATLINIIKKTKE